MSTLPAGLKVQKVDYNNQASLVEALKGQEALVITMGFGAPPDQQTKLINAAATAGVPWILPNEYVHNWAHPGLSQDLLSMDEGHTADREHIEKLGKSSWIGVICGSWYEFSLGGGPERYGFDLKKREVTFYDDGNTKVNTSTWPQCGRAVANLLALKVLPDDENDTSACLSHHKNQFIYISSFAINQRDMLDSVLRVTKTTPSDWQIKYEPCRERYKAGLAKHHQGDSLGLFELVYARMFYPDGSGNYERSMGLQNDILGLPEEDIDEYTTLAVQYAAQQAL